MSGRLLILPGGLRRLPWIIALLGLAIPLLVSGLAIWPLVVAWLVALTLAWLFGCFMLRERSHRIAAGVLLLPVLVLLGWEGGWWLIPAGIAWLIIELADHGTRGVPSGPAPIDAPDSAGKWS